MGGDGKEKAQPRVGVLALQGAFAEHIACLASIGVESTEVRTATELAGLDALVMPGGESTAMALVGETTGVWEALRTFVREGKPVWGTCAGMILLSDDAIGVKKGGQALVGGLNVQVCRNYFGAQVRSFELEMQCKVASDGAEQEEKGSSCNGVFIRAPAILAAGDGVEVLATMEAAPDAKASRALAASEGDDSDAKRRKVETTAREVIVAVRKGNILATAFHPELTEDMRWHRYFAGMLPK